MEVTLHTRKGARSRADITPDILDAINAGKIPTVNLVEYLAADLAVLLPAVATQIGLDSQHPELLKTIARLPSLKPMQRHWAIAQSLLSVIDHNTEIEQKLSGHISDLARQWAALFAGLRPDLDLSDRLRLARPFAADAHFGVREIAWLAVRKVIAAKIVPALELLRPWTVEPDPNIRRFASEVTRPRGVWCAHIELLKTNPELGLYVLEKLQDDPSRYVQDSVGNWLNDASKTRPEWVRMISREWLEKCDSKNTRYICQRAMRSAKAKIQN